MVPDEVEKIFYPLDFFARKLAVGATLQPRIGRSLELLGMLRLDDRCFGLSQNFPHPPEEKGLFWAGVLLQYQRLLRLLIEVETIQHVVSAQIAVSQREKPKSGFRKLKK